MYYFIVMVYTEAQYNENLDIFKNVKIFLIGLYGSLLFYLIQEFWINHKKHLQNQKINHKKAQIFVTISFFPILIIF